MRFGVNYTPAVGWFHSWLDFSPSDVERDLERIAALGADHVRIFPLWPLIQPNRTLIRSRGLEDVARVVDLAGALGLDVAVDALQGHLSSFDFLPAWLDSWHRRNLFTDPEVVAATAQYVRELARVVADRPNLLAFTVGNEVNQFGHAPHPSPHPVTAGEGHAWLDAMVSAAREGLRIGAHERRDPLVCVAQYDAAWYDPDQPFGPDHAAEHGDATVVHSWVFNGAARIHGALGAGSVRHAEYLLRLAEAWHEHPDRPLWLQEVGSPGNVVPAGDGPEFLERTVAHAVDVHGLEAITWWCSHDVSRSLADFPELEYDLGLLSNDGAVKPLGRRFAEAAAVFRDRPQQADPGVAVVIDDLDVDGRVLDVRGECGPGGDVAEAWLRVAESEGAGPRILLRSRVGRPETVRERGITRTIELEPTARGR